MVNNFELITSLLKFDNPEDFYYLQVIQRKKDMPPGYKYGTNNNSRSIKNYYITNLEYLEVKMPEIIKLCEVFNARASIRLNKRSFKNVAYRTLTKIAGTMANGNYFHIRNSYAKACGTGHNDKNKKWILDLDEPHQLTDEYLNKLIHTIEGFRPEGNKLIATIPSKSGLHLITKPFDLSKFEFEGIDIHKDNPTNLYIP